MTGHGTVTADPVPVAARVAGPRRSGDLVVVPVRLDRVVARGRATRVRAPVVVLARARRGPDCCRANGSASWVDSARRGRRSRPRPRCSSADLPSGSAGPRCCSGPPAACGPGCGARATGCRPPSAGCCPGWSSATRRGCPTELSEDFRTAGLTHLDGGQRREPGHRRRLRPGRGPVARPSAVDGCRRLAAVAMAGFVVLARPQPSVLRAAAMGAVGAGGARDRASRGAASPRCRRGGRAAARRPVAGPLLRLRAVGARDRRAGPPRPGLGADWHRMRPAAPGWRRRSPSRWPRRWRARRWWRCSAEQVSLVAVPANLLVAPAVAPATVLGVLATVVSRRARPGAAGAGLDGRPARLVGRAGGAERPHRPDAAVGWPSDSLGCARCWRSSRLPRRWWPGAAARRTVPAGGVAVVVVVAPGRARVGARVAAARTGCWPSATSARATRWSCPRGRAGPSSSTPGRTARRSTGACAGSGVRAGARRRADPPARRPRRGPARGPARPGRRRGPGRPVRRARAGAGPGAAVGARQPRCRVTPGRPRRPGPGRAGCRWQVVWPARVIDGPGRCPTTPALVLLVRIARTCGCC